jgi:hypothetical protein
MAGIYFSKEQANQVVLLNKTCYFYNLTKNKTLSLLRVSVLNQDKNA